MLVVAITLRLSATVAVAGVIASLMAMWTMAHSNYDVIRARTHMPVSAWLMGVPTLTAHVRVALFQLMRVKLGGGTAIRVVYQSRPL